MGTETKGSPKPTKAFAITYDENNKKVRKKKSHVSNARSSDIIKMNVMRKRQSRHSINWGQVF